jgi:hypothetical protein
MRSLTQAQELNDDEKKSDALFRQKVFRSGRVNSKLGKYKKTTDKGIPTCAIPGFTCYSAASRC